MDTELNECENLDEGVILNGLKKLFSTNKNKKYNPIPQNRLSTLKNNAVTLVPNKNNEYVPEEESEVKEQPKQEPKSNQTTLSLSSGPRNYLKKGFDKLDFVSEKFPGVDGAMAQAYKVVGDYVNNVADSILKNLNLTYARESIIRESYKDFDSEEIASYVRNFKNKIGVYKSAEEMLAALNSYLEPLNIEIIEAWNTQNLKWITIDIAMASMLSDGTIQIQVGSQTLFEDLEWDYQNNVDPKNDTDFNEFLKQLAFVIVHEMVHRYQYSSHSERKTSDPQEGMYDYLRNKDEIAAHAISGITEARSKGYEDSEILERLSSTDTAESLILELDATTDYYDFVGEPEFTKLVKTMANYILSGDR